MRSKIALFLLSALTIGAADKSSTCIFCEIAAGRTAQTRTICYQDDTVVAFMNRAPRNPGHVLVVPIRHANDLLDVPTATVEHMAMVAQMIARAIKKTDLKAEGFNFQSNTGKIAGQSVFHLHFHVIPRFAGEAPADSAESRPIAPSVELEAIAQKIRAALSKEPISEGSVSP